VLGFTPPSIAKLGRGGEEVFGYAEAFDQQLQRLEQISSDQFAALFPNPTNYLPRISWDPTTASFWGAFNADIDIVNRGKQEGEPGFRTVDYRLNGPELAAFRDKGFVVSERLKGQSFAEVFYKLWQNDLPVFISTDALLQAWHRTYDAMLEEIEETYLFESVQTMLNGMAAQIANASGQAGGGGLKESLLDADYFIAVARSLLGGQQISNRLDWVRFARVASTNPN
jgi:hypothetical protein